MRDSNLFFAKKFPSRGGEIYRSWLLKDLIEFWAMSITGHAEQPNDVQ